MRSNFVVCQLDDAGNERFLKSFVKEQWTDVMYYGLSFASEKLADNVASWIANQSDVYTYVRLRVREDDRVVQGGRA